MTDKQLEANRRNSIKSTGPRTLEGADASKLNAFRHGLRAVQTVVPGENLEDWEAHRTVIEDDLAPLGAMEQALAEQVAVKLWRLGRVVRYEADLIANGQAEDELLRAHEMIHYRGICTTGPKRTDIPTRNDVASARQAAEKAAKKLTEQAEALGQLQALAAMEDDDAFPNWSLYEVLRDEFRLDKDYLERLFEGEGDGPFRARHARKMILDRFSDNSDLDNLQEGQAAVWAEKLEQLKKDADSLQANHQSLARRYEEALERLRLASGLPDAKDLDRIQRYEAHLERGLHKDLDRLHDLQVARGAVPPRGPSVAVAVIQTGPEAAAANEMASFGSFDLEAPETTQEPAGVDGQG